MRTTNNLHVVDAVPLVSPEALRTDLPMSPTATETVAHARDAIADIIRGDDHRRLVVVGPCSIHDVVAAREYAQFLAPLAHELRDSLVILMRVYFEKPRTTIGWKGLVNDPHLDGSYDMPTGLRMARSLLLELAEMGLPAATEILDPITPQYFAELISWAAVGARTTESQTHREMASGLSMPIGFKNSTDGSLQAAVNAMQSARQPHRFLGINQWGQVSVIHTTGNRHTHVVLRGSESGPNYSSEHLTGVRAMLETAGYPPQVMIDCSHGNSEKDYRRQPQVLDDVCKQIADGESMIMGAMIESNLVAGKQAFPQPVADLRYGQSITDACVDCATTESMLRQLARTVAQQPSPA
ncbi:MAG: 3-deoxy-7-phosphoheptulonate synthase [Planctomycetota bacterium]|nr:MAG: 3-deoxy-7-phosphoheptulonate synthase [Planctomycetota bacterium]